MGKRPAPQYAAEGAGGGSGVDCLEGFDDRQHLWSMEKKRWCCLSKGVACHDDEGTTTMPPFDCSEGLNTWRKSWSQGKQAWCCLYKSIGCHSWELPKGSSPPAQLEPRFNCEAKLFKWRSEWSFEKKEWCCVHGGAAVRSHLRESLGCFDPGSDGRPGLVEQTFQQKFKVNLEHRFTMALPIVGLIATLAAFFFSIRACSRGSRPGDCGRTLVWNSDVVGAETAADRGASGEGLLRLAAGIRIPRHSRAAKRSAPRSLCPEAARDPDFNEMQRLLAGDEPFAHGAVE